MLLDIKEIRSKKLKDMTREELTILRKDVLRKINNTNSFFEYRQESKYLEKLEKEIRKRNIRWVALEELVMKAL